MGDDGETKREREAIDVKTLILKRTEPRRRRRRRDSSCAAFLGHERIRPWWQLHPTWPAKASVPALPACWAADKEANVVMIIVRFFSLSLSTYFFFPFDIWGQSLLISQDGEKRPRLREKKKREQRFLKNLFLLLPLTHTLLSILHPFFHSAPFFSSSSSYFLPFSSLQLVLSLIPSHFCNLHLSSWFHFVG